jgi:hypothetical protein
VIAFGSPARGTIDAAKFKNDVMQAVGKPSGKWQEIRFDEIKKDNVRATILYKQMPSSLHEVELDTKSVARAILKVLVAQGRNPRAEWIGVFVHAHKPERGETGASVVRVFGRTMYNFNNDQLEFKPAK